jgi:hypothetical protein
MGSEKSFTEIRLAFGVAEFVISVNYTPIPSAP